MTQLVTTLFLIRHAVHDRVDSILCGRMAEVTLSDRGRQQAAALAVRLRDEGIVAVYTSPLARARETAEFFHPSPVLRDELSDIDFGEWTGRSFASLAGESDWRRWNEERSLIRPPRGESMAEVQQRALGVVKDLLVRHPNDAIALISHQDVIKAMLMAWLLMPLDAWARFEIAPASVSVVALWNDGAKVIYMNKTLAV